MLTEIGDVGVARHLSQGSSFSAATDEDRNVWLLHRPRAGEPGVANLEVLAPIGNGRVTPQPRNDFYRFAERLVALSRRREGQSQLLELPGVVPDTDAEDKASLAQAIDIRRLPGQNDRVAIVNAADQRPEPNSLRGGGTSREHVPRIDGSAPLG